MIGIVLVSHSPLLAQGVCDLAQEMAHDESLKIVATGGVDDETIGTNAERIHQALLSAYSVDGVLVLFDLGSAFMSTELAIEMLPESQQAHIKMSNAPLVEGAVVAAVEASMGHDLETVNKAAESAKEMQKIL